MRERYRETEIQRGRELVDVKEEVDTRQLMLLT